MGNRTSMSDETDGFLYREASDMLFNGKPASGHTFCAIGKVYGSYEVISKIGEGAFGQVFKVKKVRDDRTQSVRNASSPLSAVNTKIFDTVFNQPSRKSTVSSPLPSQFYAMKVMVAPTSSTTTNTTQMMNAQAKIDNEINILKSLDHPNVLKYVDQFYLKIDFTPKIKKDAIALVSEYCDGGSLGDIIDLGQSSRLPYKKLVEWFSSMVDVLVYFEKKGVIHRDIKPGNLLLSDGVVKLADFGLAKSVLEVTSTQNHTICGSPLYISPEVAFRNAYSSKADVFSMGVTFLEVCSGVSHDQFTSYFQSEKVDLQPLLDKIKLPSLRVLINSCIAPNPIDRVSVDQLSKHPILQAYRFLIGEQLPKDPKNVAFLNVVISAIELIYHSGDINMGKEICKGLDLINNVLPNQTLLDSMYEGEHSNFVPMVLIMGTMWSNSQSRIADTCESFLKKYIESGYLYKEHFSNEIVSLLVSYKVPTEKIYWFLDNHILKHFDEEIVSLVQTSIESASQKLNPSVASALLEKLSSLDIQNTRDSIEEI